jgi:hypothetical protein
MKSNLIGWAALALVLSACGGGGGGGGGTATPPVVTPPAPDVKILSGTVTRYAAQNSGVSFEVQIKPNFTPSGTFSVSASDKAGVIAPQVVVTPAQDGSYVLALDTAAGAPAGHYTGDITFKLCADQACAASQAVPTVTVPFDLTVLAAGSAWPGDRLTTLVPWADVPDWSTFQGNAAHTGSVPVEIKPEQILPRWKSAAITQATGGYSYTYPTTLTAAGGLFYAAGDNVLKARREHDGSVAWTYDVSGLKYPSVNPPAVANGVVYMAAGQQDSTYLFAFDAASGAVRFKTPMSSQWEHYLAPVALADAVYTNAGTYGGLYAFTSAGDKLFTGTTTQQSMWSPAVDAKSVYVYDGSLRLFDPKNGQVQASIKDPNYQNFIYEIDGAPVLGADGSVFVANYSKAYLNGGTMGNQLLKFNTAKGYLDWFIAGNYPATPAYAAGVVYAPNTSPYRIEARAEADGALQWSWTPPQAADTGWASEPIVTRNLLFISTNKATYAIDLRTRKPVWSYPAAGRLALTRSGVLYIQNADALVAFNLK